MRKKMSEIVDIIDGDRGTNYPKQDDFSENGFCLFLNTGNVRKEGFSFETNVFITKEKDSALRKGKLQRDDIVYTTRGTVGNVGYYSSKVRYEHIRINSGMVIFRAIDTNVSMSFLYHLLRSKGVRKEFLSYCTGSAQPQLPIKILKEIKVDIPDIEIQQRIVSILSSYDDLIENNQKQIKLLEEAAQRLYKEWFVDLRFPGHENVEFVDGLPRGWEWKRLGEVCKTYGGGTPSTKEPSYYDNGNLLWVTPTDITRNSSLVLLDTEKKITEEGLKNSSAKMVPEESILMTSRASVGYFGVCEKSVCTNQGFISCVPNQTYYQMYLLYNLMNRVDEIRQKAGGSTYLEISKKTFRDFEIALPDVEILMEFQKIEHKIFEETRSLAKKIVSLKEARDRLLPKLMSGEVEV